MINSSSLHVTFSCAEITRELSWTFAKKVVSFSARPSMHENAQNSACPTTGTELSKKINTATGWSVTLTRSLFRRSGKAKQPPLVLASPSPLHPSLQPFLLLSGSDPSKPPRTFPSSHPRPAQRARRNFRQCACPRHKSPSRPYASTARPHAHAVELREREREREESESPLPTPHAPS
jgi:hypothetical protein